jgi:hypothetical protein
MAVIIPHEAAYSVAHLGAMFLQSVGNLIRSIPGLFQRLPMRAFGLHGDDFYIGI